MEPSKRKQPENPYALTETLIVCNRAWLIDEGLLIPIDVNEARNEGFRVPIALTKKAWSEVFLLWEDQLGRHIEIDQQRRAQLLRHLRRRIESCAAPSQDEIAFSLTLPIPDESHREVQLYATCGPGDDFTPVVTIMLLEEA